MSDKETEGQMIGELQESSESKQADYEDIESTGKRSSDDNAVNMMTDMKIVDDEEEQTEAAHHTHCTPFENTTTGSGYAYHIQFSPWTVNDITDTTFVRLVQTAPYSQLTMSKPLASEETEYSKDIIKNRLRTGVLNLYCNCHHTADHLIKCSLLPRSVSKFDCIFNVEVHYKCPDTETTMSASMEVVKGNLLKRCLKRKRCLDIDIKARSLKLSNVPSNLSVEFVNSLLPLAYVISDNCTESEGDGHRKQMTGMFSDIADFNGTVQVGCFHPDICRSLLKSIKSLVLNGQVINITPSYPMMLYADVERVSPTVPNYEKIIRVPYSTNTPRQQAGYPTQALAVHERGDGKQLVRVIPQQKSSAASLMRPGHGMPVPMTGRQKMNEKIRRNTSTVGSSGGAYNISQNTPRKVSVGDSFKREISELQKQLHESTQALEAKIAMLQQKSEEEELLEVDAYSLEGRYNTLSWDEDSYLYDDEYSMLEDLDDTDDNLEEPCLEYPIQERHLKPYRTQAHIPKSGKRRQTTSQFYTTHEMRPDYHQTHSKPHDFHGYPHDIKYIIQPPRMQQNVTYASHKPTKYIYREMNYPPDTVPRAMGSDVSRPASKGARGKFKPRNETQGIGRARGRSPNPYVAFD